MQLKTLQIVWHGKEPVLSVDFQPNSHNLVSGGQDGEVKHWEVVVEEDGTPGVRFLNSYTVNSKSVNCVRFSPAGDLLASAGDKGEILLWRFAAFAAGTVQASEGGGVAGNALASGGGLWRQVGLLRGHCDDVLDLAWAPDGSALLSGGVENNCILWDVEGRKSLKWLQDHGHYVQGVAWDPLGRYIASQSADRTARVYGVKPPPTVTALDGAAKRSTAAAAAAASLVVTSAGLAREGLYAVATLAKAPLAAGGPPPPHLLQQTALGAAAGGGTASEVAMVLPAGGVANATTTKQPLFWDDSLSTFFRRLAWSPDGAFLAMPGGVYRCTSSAPVTSTTHIFSRGDWSCPTATLPCLSKGALVVRFCPRLFRSPQPPPVAAYNRNGNGHSTSRLPYRIIMAVASVDSVILYDMQALEPLAVLGGIHFAAVTDLAWSDDGRFLVVASRDGYCTVCSFEEGELGEPVALEELPPGVAMAVSRAAARRHQERSVAAVAAAAAAKATVAVAAAVVLTTQDGGETDDQPSAAATTSAAAVAAVPLPRRIQPIAVPAVATAFSCAAPNRVDGASAKRPADADPIAVGGVVERPKPKRIQPIPLSAMALAADVPAAAGGWARGGSLSSAPAGTISAGTVVAPLAVPPSPGRRRIVPIRVDVGPAGAIAPVAVKAVAAPTGIQKSPLQSAAANAGINSAAFTAAGAGTAPSCTPFTGGASGMMLPGMATEGVAPRSAVKMPTPQVLVFGTPPGSSAQRHIAAAHEAISEPRTGLAPPAAAISDGRASLQPKPRRVTPVPVHRGSEAALMGPAAAPPPPRHQQLVATIPWSSTAAGGQQATPRQPLLQQQPVYQTAVEVGRDSAAVVSGTVCSSAPGSAIAGVVAVAAVPAAAAGSCFGSRPRLSVAQLAAMRGAAAAKKAAEANT